MTGSSFNSGTRVEDILEELEECGLIARLIPYGSKEEVVIPLSKKEPSSRRLTRRPGVPSRNEMYEIIKRRSLQLIARMQ